MIIKRFIIEVEEGSVECENCPLNGCKCVRGSLDILDCNKYNLATMKIKKYEETKI